MARRGGDPELGDGVQTSWHRGIKTKTAPEPLTVLDILVEVAILAQVPVKTAT